MKEEKKNEHDSDFEDEDVDHSPKPSTINLYITS